jgi:hypothetical protein
MTTKTEGIQPNIIAMIAVIELVDDSLNVNSDIRYTIVEINK